MRKANSTILIMCLCLIAGLASFYYWSQLPDQNVQEAKIKKELFKTSEKIWSVWTKGYESKIYKGMLKSCPQKDFGLDGRCNQALIRCIGSQLSEKIEVREVVSKAISLAKSENSFFEIYKEGVSISIELKSHCNKLYLPQRIYGMGAAKNPDPSMRFDNFDRHIFLDKKLTVTSRTTLEQMKNICAKRGMQLVESHILDAASFHPVDLKNNRPQELLRPPLPWTRSYKSEFVYKASHDKDFKFNEEYCDYIVTKECENSSSSSLPSWMGIKDPLGGVIEVVWNPHSQKAVLVPSSTYFPLKSKWHRLGLRADWGGESFDIRDFDFGKKEDTPDELLFEGKGLVMGFRCMQEVWR